MSVLLQPRTYQAHTTLLIGTTITDPNPSSNELQLGQQLAAAYADLANRAIIRNATRDALGMDQLPAYLARALPNTQLIEITVNDTDPKRAQAVANELAAQLILLGPLSTQPEEKGRQEFIHERLNVLETEINETESQIEKLQSDLGNAFSAQQIKDLQDQISSLQSKLNSMENNYGLLISNSKQGATNTLTVIATAELPSSPIGPMKGMTILLAAAAGLVLAVCEAYLLEYLDDTLKSPDEVERLFSAPVIGHIFEQADGIDGNRLYDADNSNHSLTEPFRVLRTGMGFAEKGHPLKTVLVSSPDIGDGKSSVAVNLALSLAQRDKKVILLDADLRKPKMHELFNLANDKGWADLVSDRAALNGNIGITEVRNVGVLTAGNTPPDPSGLLSSEKMGQFLSKLEDASDVVILDGPPFIVADAMILASKVDGVLVVVRPGHTRRPLAKASMEQIKLAGAKVIGVVLNRIPLRGADYYAGKSYLPTYYSYNYGYEREGKEREYFPGSIVLMDLEKSRVFLSPYLEKLRIILSPSVNKVTNFFKHLFGAVFRRSPK
jgi:capsular exopolysaccharide synthesis family protein